MSKFLGTALVVALVITLCLALLFIGPACLCYDVYHLSATFGSHTVDLDPWNPPALIGGVILSEVVIPLAFFVWLAVSFGIFK